MQESAKSICILSFSFIHRDARVLRQIRYLLPHYRLVVIGYGPLPECLVGAENVEWKSINGIHPEIESPFTKGPKSPVRISLRRCSGNSIIRFLKAILRRFKQLLNLTVVGLGRFHPQFFEIWYWKQGHHVRALKYAVESRCDAFHANDWEGLPVAATAAGKNNARLVFDAHEYAPLEFEDRGYWRVLLKPAVIYFLKKFSSSLNNAVTVGPLIAERYRKEFGFDPLVILNTPERVPLSFKEPLLERIRLVHHGGTLRDRKLEKMIETLSLCDQRFSLHFLLLNTDLNYLRQLKKLAERLTPGRIFFHDPVSPEKVVSRISEYHMGFYLLPPLNFNNLVALPNKFFDFIVAGLAVCVGPSPSMAEIVDRFGIGIVAPSFEPRDVAQVLNRMTNLQLSKMRLAAEELGKEINAEREMGKLVSLYDRIFNVNA